MAVLKTFLLAFLVFALASSEDSKPYKKSTEDAHKIKEMHNSVVVLLDQYLNIYEDHVEIANREFQQDLQKGIQIVSIAANEIAKTTEYLNLESDEIMECIPNTILQLFDLARATGARQFTCINDNYDKMNTIHNAFKTAITESLRIVVVAMNNIITNFKDSEHLDDYMQDMIGQVIIIKESVEKAIVQAKAILETTTSEISNCLAENTTIFQAALFDIGAAFKDCALKETQR